MNFVIYAKHNDDIETMEEITGNVCKSADTCELVVENKRSFRELENIKNNLGKEDIVVVSAIDSLGTNNSSIANNLSWFIDNNRLLLICDTLLTYEYGISQPINKSVLKTLLQYLIKDNSVIEIPRGKKASGRNKIEYPENWDELYHKWIQKELTSKEVIDITGLKKTIFYNLVTEYRELLKKQDNCQKKYKQI